MKTKKIYGSTFTKQGELKEVFAPFTVSKDGKFHKVKPSKETFIGTNSSHAGFSGFRR